jgi:hypothetical protein
MLLEGKVIAIYCIIDDMFKGIGHKEHSKRKLSDSEVITTAVVSALYFGGHYDNARGYMKSKNLCPNMLEKSRFCRRLHALNDLLVMMFFQVGEYLKTMAGASSYIIDSFPIPVCDNMRISRCHILKGKQWRGRQASMHRYFYGVKIHVLVTAQGIPVEFCFVPGSENDVQGLKKIPLHLTPESEVYGDAGYTDYKAEDDAKDAEDIRLLIQRKHNSKRPDKAYEAFIKEYMRKKIETSFSCIKALFLRKIHAVNFEGFLIKILLFIWAYTLDKITPNLAT